MSPVVFFFYFIPFLTLVLLTINLVLAPHNPYKEKDTPFECGIHSFLTQSRIQFTISFFIFGLLFLLFDLEILLIYPFAVSSAVNFIYGLLNLIVFILVLTLGFVFELGKDALKIDVKQPSFDEDSAHINMLSSILPNFIREKKKSKKTRRNSMARFHKTSKRNGLITSLITTATAIVVPTYVAPWWIGLVKYAVIGVIVITGYVSGGNLGLLDQPESVMMYGLDSPDTTCQYWEKDSLLYSLIKGIKGVSYNDQIMEVAKAAEKDTHWGQKVIWLLRHLDASGICFHDSHSFSTYLLGRVDANVVTFWPTSVEDIANYPNIFSLVMVCSCCHTNLVDYANRVFHCLACKHFVCGDCIMGNGGWAPISIYGPKDDGLYTAYMLQIEGGAPIALNMEQILSNIPDEVFKASIYFIINGITFI